MNINFICSHSVMLRILKLCAQFVKYISVGLISNILAYSLYLVFTLFSLAPVVSMSVVYVIAGACSFSMNKVWTFRSNGFSGRPLVKYIFIQFIGYFSNLLILSVLHYDFAVPHYYSQLVGMAVVAVVLFLLSRYYVFI